MRIVFIAAIAGLLFPATGRAAPVCDPFSPACGPDVVVFPAYTPEGLRLGSVEASVHLALPLEISPFTGRPLTVVYNNPTREPGAVDPDIYLMRLPRVRPSRTRAVYPVGY